METIKKNVESSFCHNKGKKKTVKENCAHFLKKMWLENSWQNMDLKDTIPY